MLVGFVMLGEHAGTLPLVGDRRRTRPAAADAGRRGAADPGRRADQVGDLPVQLLAAGARWPRPPRSAPTCTRRRWSRPASTWSRCSAPAFADAGRGGRSLLDRSALVTMLVGGWRGAAPARPQAAAGLRHGQPARPADRVLIGARQPRTPRSPGVAMLLAHALFKAALFLVVGVIDHAAGTRDLRRALRPAAVGPPVLAVDRRARRRPRWPGVPPLLGFVAKEAVFEAPPARRRPADRGRARRPGRWARCSPSPTPCASSGAPSPTSPAVAAAEPAAAPAGRSSPRRPCSRSPGWSPGWPPPAVDGLLGRLRRTAPGPPATSYQLALWHGAHARARPVRAGAGRRRRLFAVRAPLARRWPRLRLPVDRRRRATTGHAAAGPARRRGHRRHPARLAAGLPRHDPRSSLVVLPGGAAARRRAVAGADARSGTARCSCWSRRSSWSPRRSSRCAPGGG